MNHILNTNPIQLPSMSKKKVVLSMLAVLIFPSLSMFMFLLGSNLGVLVSNRTFSSLVSSGEFHPSAYNWDCHVHLVFWITLFYTLATAIFWMIRAYHPQSLLNALSKVQNLAQSPQTQSWTMRVVKWVIFPIVLVIIPGGIFILFGLLFL